MLLFLLFIMIKGNIGITEKCISFLNLKIFPLYLGLLKHKMVKINKKLLKNIVQIATINWKIAFNRPIKNLNKFIIK